MEKPRDRTGKGGGATSTGMALINEDGGQEVAGG